MRPWLALALLVTLASLGQGCAATMTGATAGAPRPDGQPRSSHGATAAPAWPQPATVEATYPDGSPGRVVTLQAVDADERHYYVATDELGRATLSIWTDRIPTWSQRSGAGWTAIAPARIRPADGGSGYRVTVTLAEEDQP